LKIGIGVVIIVAVVIIAAIAVPLSTTSSLRIKYISSSTNSTKNDSVGYGGKILIFIDWGGYWIGNNWIFNSNCVYGTYHADQYITFSGISIGKHTIEVYKGTIGNWSGNEILAGKDVTTHAAILGDTIVDIHYTDGFL
jgi:hypothetical protein